MNRRPRRFFWLVFWLCFSLAIPPVKEERVSDRIERPGFLTTLGIRLRNVTIRRYSSRGAGRYETHRDGGRWQGEFAAVRYFYGKVNPRSVLDLPCGTGRWFEIYRSNGASVVGIDISENMLTEAREKVPAGAEVRLERADVLDTANPPDIGKGYDLIVCTRFVYWLRPPELAIMLRRFGSTDAPFLLASAKVEIEEKDRKPAREASGKGLAYRLDRLRARFYRAVIKRLYKEADLLTIFSENGWRLAEKRLIVKTRSHRYFYYLFERT